MSDIDPRLELRQLKYFIAVVDAGSITRASQSVHIAQPALSQQMVQLEDIVGAPLLVRSRLGVKPTPAGEALYRHAQAILRMVGETRSAVSGRGLVVSGRVRLNLPSSIAVVLAAPLMQAVRDRFPEIRLELHESPSAYLAAQLLDERVDLSVLVDLSPRSEIRATSLLDDRVFFVSGTELDDLPSMSNINLATAAMASVIMPTSATTLRQILDREFAEVGVEPRIYGEVSSIPSMITLTEALGVACFVPGAAIREQDAKKLYVYAIDPPIWRRATLAQSLSRPLSPAAEKVRELLLATVSRLTHKGVWLGSRLCEPDSHDREPW
jgi:LysR family transcriptional regulator, nitrogen assimilation regulatory protein